MKTKQILTWGFLLFSLCRLSAAGEPTKKITPPRRIEYDGKILRYNPAWKDKEIYMETNLDAAPGDEILISFIATYAPQSELVREKEGDPLTLEKKELPILENYAFYQIYTKGAGSHWALTKTIHGMDQLGEVKTATLDKNKPKAIIFLNPGGENYTDLSVYQWRQGGYRLLFNTGSSRGITINAQETPLTIRLAQNSPQEEIWQWESGSDQFQKKISVDKSRLPEL